MLPSLPQDKANHLLYGSFLFSIVYTYISIFSMSEWIPYIVVVLAAAGKELLDYLSNKRAIANGITPYHGVEFLDFVATCSGMIPPAIIVLVNKYI